MRTYGTYQFRPTESGPLALRAQLQHHTGTWRLDLEPAAATRVKRIFGRVQESRGGMIVVAHTLEVARDLAWAMERWPMRPRDSFSAALLEHSQNTHRTREREIGEVLAGTAPRLELPVDVAKTPREYQLQAIQLLKTRGRILLGDAVGLGKTFTSLLATTLEGALPALVVPPTHLPSRWVTELQEAFPSLTYSVARSSVPPDRIFEGDLRDVEIVPYSKLHGWAKAIAPYVRTVIFDEAQELRHGAGSEDNPESGTKKGRAAALVAENATYVIGATATPVYNYGSEVWNIADILSPGELGTRPEFVREWGGATMTNGRTIVKDPHGLGSYLREAGFLLARDRTEVGRELPKTVKHTMTVETNPAALDAVRSDAKALARMILDSQSDRQDRFQAAGQIDMMVRQATGVGKAPFVAEFCKLLLESEQRIIIWGWHREVYDILMAELADYNPRLYTGTESPKQKLDAERAFTASWLDENDPTVTREQLAQQCRVLIMSLRSGAGVDGLQKVASVGVFAELDWSPQVHEQAIGRIRRDGMGEAPPVIYFLVSEDGSDPALMEVLGVKRQQSERLMSSDGQLLTSSTVDPDRAKRLARQMLGLPEPLELSSDSETEGGEA